MFTLTINKPLTRTHAVTKSHTVKRNLIVKASKPSQEIKHLLRNEIAKANDVCCDMTKSDLDCMLQWDVIDDLSHALRIAIDDEKRQQEQLDEQTDKNYIWNTSKKTFDL
jgi:hypothetical protein